MNMKVLHYLVLGGGLMAFVNTQHVQPAAGVFTDADGDRLRERRAACPQVPSGNSPPAMPLPSAADGSPPNLKDMFTTHLRRNADWFPGTDERKEIHTDRTSEESYSVVVSKYVVFGNRRESLPEDDEPSADILQRLKRQTANQEQGKGGSVRNRRGDVKRQNGPKKQKQQDGDTPAPDEIAGGERQKRQAEEQEGGVSDAPPPKKGGGKRRPPPPGKRRDCQKRPKQNETSTPDVREPEGTKPETGSEASGVARKKRDVPADVEESDDKPEGPSPGAGDEGSVSDDDSSRPPPPPPRKGPKRHGPPKGKGYHGRGRCDCKRHPPPPKENPTDQEKPETGSEASGVARKKRDAPADVEEGEDKPEGPSQGAGDEEGSVSDDDSSRPPPPPPRKGPKRHGPPKGKGHHGRGRCDCKRHPPPPKENPTDQEKPETGSEAPEVARQKRDAPKDVEEGDDKTEGSSGDAGDEDDSGSDEEDSLPPPPSPRMGPGASGGMKGTAGCFNYYYRGRGRGRGGGNGGGGGGGGGVGGGGGMGGGVPADDGAEADAEMLEAYKQQKMKQKLRKKNKKG